MKPTHDDQTKTADAGRWLVKVGQLPGAFVLCNFLGWRYVPVSHWLTRDGEKVIWLPDDDELTRLIIAEVQRRSITIAVDWCPGHSEARGWYASISNLFPCNDSSLIVALVQAVAVWTEEETDGN